MGTLAYIKNFIKDRDVAAITPSSKFLVKRVCRWIDFSAPNIIVEYGPGTGVFSRYILEEMHDDSTLVLIEGNRNFVEELEALTDGDPRATVVHDRVENIETILDRLTIDAADYIISGIPFSFLDDDVKDELLVHTRRALADTGKFLVYQNYNHMEDPLRQHFNLASKEYELRNIPPMFAYEALKP
ncbi:class I SAM-dependent methyltransferase [Salisaeta longa]|uniref:class I SAM-dependent methyltransferase n=1 Tax=Salisaeta longa TaxID=503170 RepID=UPI0003B66529|nr:rRNA adenine N-6-methyltransferase family protein [Salisaeta longa]